MEQSTLQTSNQDGMTLVELMFAGTIAVGIVAAGLAVVTSFERSNATTGQTGETQQNVRNAMEMLARDIRQAGFGSIGAVGNCPTAIVPQDNAVAGPDTGPDRISLVVPLGNPVGTVTRPAWVLPTPIGPGFISFTLSSVQAVTDMTAEWGGGILVGATVSVAGSATATVTAVSGSTITITPAVPAPAAFGANTPVYLLQCITYQIIPPPDVNGLCDGRSPCLVRGVGTGGRDCNTPNSRCLSIADEIEDMQFTYACDGCNLALNGGIPDGIIDNQVGSAPGFDPLDFVSNNVWNLVPMTPDKISLVQVNIVGRERSADQGVGEGITAGRVVQAQAMQVSDHNHGAGLFTAGDFAGLTPPYTSTRRRMFTRTIEVRNPGR
jgi:type IV pilus assembly protein PilW